MNTVGRRIVFGVLLCTCLGLLASGAIASDAIDTRDVVGTVSAEDADNEDGNESVRHEDPAEYGEDGDLDSVQRWLERQLSSNLEESALQLSQGEYDTARQFVDEEYRSQLDRLVEVDGETGNYDTDDENETSPDESFEEVRDGQTRLADLLEEFDETHTAYEQAVEEGNDELARELARDLEELAAEIDTVSDEIEVHFDRLTDSTDADLEESADAINETNQQVQEQQTVIRVEQFEETVLTVETDQQSASFLDPLEVSGTLRTVDGRPFANEAITLEIDGQAQTVHTDVAGRFDLQYRPVEQPLSTDELAVRYVPERQSMYLGTETTVPVSIDQVDPTLTVLETTDAAAYNEPVTVTGELAVDDLPVDDVPLEVFVAGEYLGDAQVSDGSFETSVNVPVTVPDGEHEVTVRLPFEDQALASTADTATLTVLETDTSLSVSHSVDDDGDLDVEGRLETVDGDGVDRQSIRILADGEQVAETTTDADGRFNVTVAATADGEGLELTAVYDGSETNLAPAEATTATSPSITSSSPSPVLVGGLVAGVVLLAGGGWWYLRRRETAPETDDHHLEDTTTDTVEEPTPTTSPDPLLERASESLAAGEPNTAIQTGYAAIRRTLRPETEDDRAQALTHWEFYRNYGGQRADDLRAVTEAYERATFTPAEISEDDATSILERINRLCELEGDVTVESSDD